MIQIKSSTYNLIKSGIFSIPHQTIALVILCISNSATINSQTINNGIFTVNPNTQLSIVEDFENNATGSFINDGETFIYSNFTNNGMVDYTNGGMVRMQGNEAQMLVANQPNYFYNLEINNTSNEGITQIGTTEVENEIDFTDGILDTYSNDATLILKQGSTVINTSDNSFVDGFITKEGNNVFTFPIGDDEFYRYAGISAPQNGTTSMRARFVFQDQNNTYPTDQIADNITLVNEEEYWVIQNESASETVTVTLSWDDNTTTPSSVVDDPSDAIRMARWDFDNNIWRQVNETIVNTNNQTISALQEIDGQAVFTIARADEIVNVPPEVIVYNGVSANNDGDNDYFRIDNIELLINNHVQIFNRWGRQVFESSDYGSSGNQFVGKSDDFPDQLLPAGTYFYIISYDFDNGSEIKRLKTSGYLYLTY